MLALPPGASSTVGSTSSEAPVVALCGWISTCQVPSPPPASETVSRSCLLCAPGTVFSSPNESDCGSVKTSGLSAVGSQARPAPSSSTEASVVLLVSEKAGPAVDISADLTCFVVQLGCRCRSSAAEPAMCGVAMLVPSKTANGEPANSGSVEDRTCAPGAEMSGFSRWPKSVGPAEEKLVITPARPVWISSSSRPTVICAWPPVEAVASSSRFPSRSEIIAIGNPTASGIGFGSPERLSTTIIPIAPALTAR